MGGPKFKGSPGMPNPLCKNFYNAVELNRRERAINRCKFGTVGC